MLSKMTIGKRLMAGMAVILALLATLGFMDLYSAHWAAEQFRMTVDNNIRGVRLADGILAAQNELLAAQRGIILAGFAKDPVEMETNKKSFSANAASIRDSLNQLRPLLASEEGRSLLSDIGDKLQEWEPHYQEILRLTATSNIAGANRIRKDALVPIYLRIRADAKRIVEVEDASMAARKAAIDASSSTNRLVASFALGASLLTIIAMLFLVNHISRQLRRTAFDLIEGAEQVAGAAIQVSSASQSLAEGATEQAASLEETSASSKEVSATARANTESCHAAADLVTHAQTQFQAANVSLDQMIESMNEISSSGTRISRIIRVIDEIAFQTNILALNAAVEAARAGEAGKGFAVVAEEVRNLAQRSATAARDTAALIEESITTSQEGRVKVDHVAAAIKDLAVEAAKVKDLVDQVNAGSEEQTKGIEMIGRSLSQIEQVTQRSAASAEESASAAHELTSQSQTVNNIVKQLMALVGEGKSK